MKNRETKGETQKREILPKNTGKRDRDRGQKYKKKNSKIQKALLNLFLFFIFCGRKERFYQKTQKRETEDRGIQK